MKQKNSYELIYDVVCQIPPGKVASYGQVAELAGNRRWVRVVGYALHALSPEHMVPWHRVVKKDGQVFCSAESAGGKRQIELLEKEGVAVENGCVDMKKYQWGRRLF